MEEGNTYAIFWDDDPKIRMVRFRGMKYGFYIFEEIDTGIVHHCKPSSVHVREVK